MPKKNDHKDKKDFFDDEIKDIFAGRYNAPVGYIIIALLVFLCFWFF